MRVRHVEPLQRFRHRLMVRGYAEDPCEDSQEVKGAEPDHPGRALEIDRLIRVRASIHRAASTARRRSDPRASAGLLSPPREDLDEAPREQHAELVETDVALALGGRLGPFTEDHQLGQWWHADRLPGVRPIADRFDQRRCQVKRQAFVAAGVFVRANVLVAGMADQDRPRHQLEGLPSGPATEAPPAHIRDREAVVELDKRRVGRSGLAPVVDHRDRFAAKNAGNHHASRSRPRQRPTL